MALDNGFFVVVGWLVLLPASEFIQDGASV